MNMISLVMNNTIPQLNTLQSPHSSTLATLFRLWS